MPSFPVDFGEQLFEPGAEIGDSLRRENRRLVAAVALADAENAPRITPGFSTGGALGAQERAISAVLSRKARGGMPLTAAGTIPKFDSTE